MLDSAKLKEVTAEDTEDEIWAVSGYVLSLGLPAREVSSH